MNILLHFIVQNKIHAIIREQQIATIRGYMYVGQLVP